MIEAGFRQAVAKEIRESHRQGLPVPVSAATYGQDGVAWLHPDGVVRPEREPIHLPAERQRS